VVNQLFPILLSQVGAGKRLPIMLMPLLLVEETHGSLGLCVSFSFIDAGSGFNAYLVFPFYLIMQMPGPVLRFTTK